MNEDDLAVALYYDGRKAPSITATGENEVARQIIELALHHDVPIYENPDLVALLATLEIGDEIPELLYRAIAEIINFAYQVRSMSDEEKRHQ